MTRASKTKSPPANLDDATALDKRYAIPPHRVGRYNNLHWHMLLPVDVSRQDHSLSMSQHLGTLTSRKTGKPLANVALALGGYVLLINPMDYKGNGMASFALDLTDACTYVLSMIPDLGAVEELPQIQRQSVPAKPRPVRKRKRGT